MDWGRPFINNLEPKTELKNLAITENSLFCLTASLETHENKVFTIPIGAVNQAEKVFLKDAQWQLQDEEDLYNVKDLETENENSKKQNLAKKAISRITVVDRFKQDELIDAMENLGIRSSEISATNVAKELEGKLIESPETAIRLLQQTKEMHKSSISALALGFVEFPINLVCVIRVQGIFKIMQKI